MFPMMGPEEFKSLMEDINKNGIREKVVLDANGRIVDGRNRAKAWLKLGKKWDDLPSVTIRATIPETEITERVWSANYERRHLTSEQKAASRLLHADRIGEVAKLEEQAKLDAEKAKRNGQKTGHAAVGTGWRCCRLAPGGIAEKVVTAYKRGGRQALEAIVDKAEKGERRARVPDPHPARARWRASTSPSPRTSPPVRFASCTSRGFLSDDNPCEGGPPSVDRTSTRHVVGC
jgi:hypothetical protein